MKPEEMDRGKLLNWIQDYLKRSKENLRVSREEFYDAIFVVGDDAKAESILRDMVLKQAVHANLLEEIYEAEQYAAAIEQLAKAAENAPKA